LAIKSRILENTFRPQARPTLVMPGESRDVRRVPDKGSSFVKTCGAAVYAIWGRTAFADIDVALLTASGRRAV
jgi:hypothetical protein